jgi:hypothetical protein
MRVEIARLARLRGLIIGSIFFVEDIRELRGVEHFPAELALDKLYVFLTGHDTNLGMFAGGRHIGKRLGLEQVCLCPVALSMRGIEAVR